MLTTLLIIAGVIVSISTLVLYRTLINAPEGHEDTAGFHIDLNAKTGSTAGKRSNSDKKSRGTMDGKAHLDAA
jgi:hypothetical protein